VSGAAHGHTGRLSWRPATTRQSGTRARDCAYGAGAAERGSRCSGPVASGRQRSGPVASALTRCAAQQRGRAPAAAPRHDDGMVEQHRVEGWRQLTSNRGDRTVASALSPAVSTTATSNGEAEGELSAVASSGKNERRGDSYQATLARQDPTTGRRHLWAGVITQTAGAAGNIRRQLWTGTAQTGAVEGPALLYCRAR
jgi:hypothetical protein